MPRTHLWASFQHLYQPEKDKCWVFPFWNVEMKAQSNQSKVSQTGSEVLLDAEPGAEDGSCRSETKPCLVPWSCRGARGGTAPRETQQGLSVGTNVEETSFGVLYSANHSASQHICINMDTNICIHLLRELQIRPRVWINTYILLTDILSCFDTKISQSSLK